MGAVKKPVLCHIYRSGRKADTYLYLPQKDDFSAVPAELMHAFGEAEFSFSLELNEGRKLAREDVEKVMLNLEEQGYHLQMADDLLVEQQLALRQLN